MVELFVQLEREGHPDSLSSKSPTAPTMTGSKLVQTQDQEACEDGYVGPFIPPYTNCSRVRSPFLTFQEFPIVGMELGIASETGCNGTNRENKHWGQLIVPKLMISLFYL